MTAHRTLLATALTVCLAAPAAHGAGWGDLKGRFVLDGSAGKAAAINVNKDADFCGKHDLKEETVQTGEGGALKNVFVFLYTRRGKSVDVHPDLAEPSSEPAVLDNSGCRFEPHAMIVRTGQTFEIRNSDPIGHNTNAQSFVSNAKFNTMVTSGKPETFTFDKSEPLPQQVACNIHPWMKAYVLIRDNPYMAVTGEDGSFEIKGLPEGEHTFSLWHEGPGNLKNLKTGGGKTDRRGRIKIEITADGVADLGDIMVPASALK